MDAKQFDELIARLSSGPSRRDALKGLVGGALAAAGLSGEALSKGKRDGKRHGRAGDEHKGKGNKGRGKGGAGAAHKGGKAKAEVGNKPNGAACKCPGRPGRFHCPQQCQSGEFRRRHRPGKKPDKCRCTGYGD